MSRNLRCRAVSLSTTVSMIEESSREIFSIDSERIVIHKHPSDKLVSSMLEIQNLFVISFRYI